MDYTDILKLRYLGERTIVKHKSNDLDEFIVHPEFYDTMTDRVVVVPTDNTGLKYGLISDIQFGYFAPIRISDLTLTRIELSKSSSHMKSDIEKEFPGIEIKMV